MGISMSTLLGWPAIIALAGYYIHKAVQESRTRILVRPASHRPRLEDRQPAQNRKDPKDKAKRQRAEAAHQAALATKKDAPEPAAKLKPRSKTPNVSTTAVNPLSSDDDGVDNREFARQLASVKQGTSLAGKKSEEKKQKSVKQSRAREMGDDHRQSSLHPAGGAAKSVVSAPSSTTGIDGDDDTSAAGSPDMRAADAAGVADILEPQASGPSVLRLTDTDKADKEAKAKPAEKTKETKETKKQRQNRKKAEAAKAERAEAEKERKVAMEAQRRTARIAEGRPAADGSVSMAAQPSAWNAASGPKANGNGVNSVNDVNGVNGANGTKQARPLGMAAAPKPLGSEGTASWMKDMPSEEEQMELLRSEEAWSTVKTKKSKKRLDGADSAGEAETRAAVPAEPRATAPDVAAPKVQMQPATNAKPAKGFSTQSAYAALGGKNEVEEEWDV